MAIDSRNARQSLVWRFSRYLNANKKDKAAKSIAGRASIALAHQMTKEFVSDVHAKREIRMRPQDWFGRILAMILHRVIVVDTTIAIIATWTTPQLSGKYL